MFFMKFLEYLFTLNVNIDFDEKLIQNNKGKKFGNKNANSYEEMEKIMKYEDQIISAYRSKLVYTFLQWKKAIQNRNEEEVEKIIKSIDFAWWFHQSQVRAINFAITYFDIHFFQFIIDNKIDNEYNHFLHDYDPNPVNHSPNRSTILHRLVKCFHLFINRNLNFRYYFPLFKQSIEYFLYDRNIPINAINKYDVLKIPLQAGFPIKNILYLWKIYEYLIGKGADIGYWNYQDTLIHHLVLGNESLQFGTSFDLHNIAKSLLIFSLDINPFFFSSHKNNNNNDNDDDDKGRKEDKEWNNYWKNNLYYEYQNYFKSKKKGVEEWKGIMIMVAKEEVPLLKLISKKERINKYATVRVELPIPSAYFRLYLHNGKEVYPARNPLNAIKDNNFE